MDDIYKNIEEYNPNKRRKILIVFGDMIADMLSNEKLNPKVSELFIRGKKFSCFYYTILFCCAKNIRPNSAHYFIIKFLNKQDFQKIAFNNSSDNNFRDFMNLYKNVLQNHILL